MMAYPYDDARIILALQIDHSRVAGYFAAHWGNRLFDRPEPYPFDIDPLPVSFAARLVPNRTYQDGEEFLGEFYRAERITVAHTLASA